MISGKEIAGQRQPDSWIDRFSGLAALDDEIRDILVARGRLVRVRAGDTVFGPAHPPDQLLLLIEGRLKVQQVSEQGRELVLYRVEAGESCVMTNACMLAFEDHAAEGIAETDIVAAAIPRTVFDDLVARSAPFRSFIFSAYSRRIADLLRVIDERTFQRFDIRLAQRLLDLAREGVVHATHQHLAAELGTAREVVSRQLGDFQRRGLVAQARGEITLRDGQALRALAASSTP